VGGSGGSLIEAKAKAQQGERTDLRPNSDEAREPEKIRTDTSRLRAAFLGQA